MVRTRATPLADLLVVEWDRYSDERGWFQERWRASALDLGGLPQTFVQDNLSESKAGVLRGLHYQKAPRAQGKLVHVLSGSCWDVAVDIRPESPSFGQWYGLELSGMVAQGLYVPPGFAHGFLALEDRTLVHYSCTQEYDPSSEGGIHWNDPDLAIAWPRAPLLISPKDASLHFWKDLWG